MLRGKGPPTILGEVDGRGAFPRSGGLAESPEEHPHQDRDDEYGRQVGVDYFTDVETDGGAA